VRRRVRFASFGATAFGALVLLAVSYGCAPDKAGDSTTENSARSADWSRFGGHTKREGAENARAVPESPAPVTGIPYVRSLRVAWSASTEVPTWEPVNQERSMPAKALQAVLSVDIRSLPKDADIRVLWYFADAPNEPIYTDRLESTEDGEHYFALCLREKGALVPLPKGDYQVELRNGATLLKSIPFEVGESEEQP